VVIQYVSPSNTFWWWTGQSPKVGGGLPLWSKDIEDAKKMLAHEAQDVLNHLERNPKMQGRIGSIAV